MTPVFADSKPHNRGVVVSLFTGGAFFGAFFAGPAGDRLGRRWTIFLGSIIFIIGGVFQTAAQTIHWMWGGRAIAGLGVGFLVMIIPVYQGEIAHPSIRGRVTALQQFMLGIGSFIAGWLSYGTFSIPSSAAYRSMCHHPYPLLIVRTTTNPVLLSQFRWVFRSSQPSSSPPSSSSSRRAPVGSSTMAAENWVYTRLRSCIPTATSRMRGSRPSSPRSRRQSGSTVSTRPKATWS